MVKKLKNAQIYLRINVGIFTEQGAAIGKNAKPLVKILVVRNPANTNALIGKNKFKQRQSTMDGYDNARCFKSKSSTCTKVKLSCR